MKSISKKKFKKKYLQLYIFIIPAFIWFLIFCYVPMYGVTLAIKDYHFDKGILFSPLAKPLFKYFTAFFSYFEFWTLLRNTFFISFLKIVVAFPIPVIFALMINEVRHPRYKKIVQTVSYLPNFVSWVVVTVLLQQLLSLDGVFNQIRTSLGLEKIFYMNDSSYFYPIMLISYIWKTIGINSIIYLATIAGIDENMYEAARIDGAGRMKQIIHITIPTIMPVMVYLFILGLAGILNAGWDQLYQLKTPGNTHLAEVLDTYVIQAGLKDGQFGYATVVSLFQSTVGLILIFITNKISKKAAGLSLF